MVYLRLETMVLVLGFAVFFYSSFPQAASMSVNKNTVHGDKSALNPGGVRIGTPAMTTRGCTEADFKKIGEFMDRPL